MNNGKFKEIKTEKLKDTLDVDVVHVSLMTSTFLNKLLARKQKSAIINVSSSIAYMNGMAGTAVYCAAKSYVNYFSLSIAEELKDKIDI